MLESPAQLQQVKVLFIATLCKCGLDHRTVNPGVGSSAGTSAGFCGYLAASFDFSDSCEALICDASNSLALRSS